MSMIKSCIIPPSDAGNGLMQDSYRCFSYFSVSR